jgi:hypothetical protein
MSHLCINNNEIINKIKTLSIMTTLEAIQLAGQIQIGTILKGRYQTMVVTKITKKRVYGYDKRNFDKRGKKSEVSMCWDILLNPHYNKDIQIINN